MKTRGLVVGNALYQDGDVTIRDAARLLGRSYTWVYMRLSRLLEGDTYRYKGVIHIRQAGFDRLAGASARAPRVGRPRKA